MPKLKKINPRDPNIVKPVTIAAYLEAKNFAENRTWSFCSIKGLTTEVNGVRLTADEFNAFYPIPVVVNFNVCAENPDKRNSFLLPNK